MNPPNRAHAQIRRLSPPGAHCTAVWGFSQLESIFWPLVPKVRWGGNRDGSHSAARVRDHRFGPQTSNRPHPQECGRFVRSFPLTLGYRVGVDVGQTGSEVASACPVGNSTGRFCCSNWASRVASSAGDAVACSSGEPTNGVVRPAGVAMTESPVAPLPAVGVAVTHPAGETVPAGDGSGLAGPAHAATDIETSRPIRNVACRLLMVSPSIVETLAEGRGFPASQEGRTPVSPLLTRGTVGCAPLIA
jgi:hypothetical protein